MGYGLKAQALSSGLQAGATSLSPFIQAQRPATAYRLHFPLTPSINCVYSVYSICTQGHHRLSQTGGPLYQQIMDQIKQKIAVGEWAAGEEIPSIRQLAVALRVSVITVKRAYLELEREASS